MAKHVEIDTVECIGCESCVEVCPEVFGFNDEDAKAYVIDSDGGDHECAQEAANTCPVQCIKVE